jgi:hypothetical protein
MNLDQFYAELKAGALKWERLNTAGLGGPPRPLLRAKVEPWPEQHPGTYRSVCPVTALCFLKTGVFHDTFDYERAALALGLKPTEYIEIVEAADKQPNTGAALEDVPQLVEIRARLLEACGLEVNP